MSDDFAVLNTDRELWREPKGDLPSDYYADSIHVTENGGIGIDCGGTVYVRTLREWHTAVAERDRIEARLADAEEHIKHREDQLRARPEGLVEALFNAEAERDEARAAAERLAEALRHLLTRSHCPECGAYMTPEWGNHPTGCSLNAALAAHEGKAAS